MTKREKMIKLVRYIMNGKSIKYNGRVLYPIALNHDIFVANDFDMLDVIDIQYEEEFEFLN